MSERPMQPSRRFSWRNTTTTTIIITIVTGAADRSSWCRHGGTVITTTIITITTTTAITGIEPESRVNDSPGLDSDPGFSFDLFTGSLPGSVERGNPPRRVRLERFV